MKTELLSLEEFETVNYGKLVVLLATLDLQNNYPYMQLLEQIYVNQVKYPYFTREKTL